MHDEISDAWISYNGEIYNFKNLRSDLLSKGVKFKSSSDTEVILKFYRLYGIEKTLQSIEGAFSFVIADKKLNKLYLVRDGFGMKPLFYSMISNKEFIFSSEIKPILLYRDYKKINPKNMMIPLMMGLSAPGKTLFENINGVRRGELISIRMDNLKIEKKTYFSCRNLVDKKYYSFLNSLSQKKLLDLYSKTLKDSVEQHLISDAPISVLFSGGIDSTLVARYALEFNKNIDCFFSMLFQRIYYLLPK